jgi:hypothetical protein
MGRSTLPRTRARRRTRPAARRSPLRASAPTELSALKLSAERRPAAVRPGNRAVERAVADAVTDSAPLPNPLMPG